MKTLRLMTCVAWLTGCVGTAELPDDEPALLGKGGAIETQRLLAQRAALECQLIFACMPGQVAWQTTWRTPQECEQAKLRESMTLVQTAGVVAPAAQLASCNETLSSMSCPLFTWLGQVQGIYSIAGCTLLAAQGTLVDDAPCAQDEQCASGVCARAYVATEMPGFTSIAPASCGTCQPGVPVGEACVDPDATPTSTLTDTCVGDASCQSCLAREQNGLPAAEGCLVNPENAYCYAPAPRSLPTPGALPLGATCADDWDCFQGAGPTYCSLTAQVCTPSGTEVGAACEAYVAFDAGQLTDENTAGCDAWHHGLACVQPCNLFEYATEVDGELVYDEAEVRACLAAHPATCQLRSRGQAAGQRCGMLTTDHGDITEMASADCQPGLYCQFTSSNSEAGTCVPQGSRGAACTGVAGDWGEECEAGLACDPTSRTCETRRPAVCN